MIFYKDNVYVLTLSLKIYVIFNKDIKSHKSVFIGK